MIKGQHSAASSELLLRVHPVGALSGQRSNEKNIYWLIVLVKMSEGQATIESNLAVKSKTSFPKGKVVERAICAPNWFREERWSNWK